MSKSGQTRRDSCLLVYSGHNMIIWSHQQIILPQNSHSAFPGRQKEDSSPKHNAIKVRETVNEILRYLSSYRSGLHSLTACLWCYGRTNVVNSVFSILIANDVNILKKTWCFKWRYGLVWSGRNLPIVQLAQAKRYSFQPRTFGSWTIAVTSKRVDLVLRVWFERFTLFIISYLLLNPQ